MTIVSSTVVVAPDPPDSGGFLTVAAPTSFPDPDVDGPFSAYTFAAGGLATYSGTETLRVISRNVGGWVLLRAQDGTTARSIAVGDIVQLVPSRLAEILDADTSTLQIVNSAADTIIYSYTIPANLLGTKGAVRMDIAGKFNNATGISRNLSFKVAFGTTPTTVYSDALSVSTDAGGFRAVDIHLVFGNDGATNAQKLSGLFSMGNNTGPSTGFGALSGLSAAYPFGGTSAKDTTLDQTLAVYAKLVTNDPALEFDKLFGYTTRVAY